MWVSGLHTIQDILFAVMYSFTALYCIQCIIKIARVLSGRNNPVVVVVVVLNRREKNTGVSMYPVSSSLVEMEYNNIISLEGITNYYSLRYKTM